MANARYLTFHDGKFFKEYTSEDFEVTLPEDGYVFACTAKLWGRVKGGVTCYVSDDEIPKPIKAWALLLV